MPSSSARSASSRQDESNNGGQNRGSEAGTSQVKGSEKFGRQSSGRQSASAAAKMQSKPKRQFRKVLWGSPRNDSGRDSKQGGKGKERRSHARTDSVLADTSTTLRVFARTGRIELDRAALSDVLAAPDFSSATFIQQHLSRMNLSGLETARGELDKFMEEVQNQVLDNAVDNNEIYVMLCESVQKLEPQLQRLHGLLTNVRALLGKLREIAAAASEAAADDGATGGASKGLSSSFSKDVAGGSKPRARVGGARLNLEPPELAPVLPVWRSFMEHLDLALAERKLHKVFRLLTAAEAVVEEVGQRCLACDDAGAMLPLQLWLEQKDVALQQSRRNAIALLERSIMEPGIARTDLQQHVRLLSKLSTPLHAVSSLLASHEQALDHFLQGVRSTSGVNSDDFELLGTVSQRVFGCIGCAANDTSLVFKKAARELSSTFTVWALRLTERCVEILLADVLVQFAAPLGLAATVECILQMLVYCSCLEDTHRICLQPHMLRVLWPHIESVITAHVNNAAERIRTAAMRDVADTVSTGRCTFVPNEAPPCGRVLVTEVCALVDELLCMDAIEVGRSMRQATTLLFRALCDGVDRGVKQAAQQNRGQLPAVLTREAESVMQCLTFVMEQKLTRSTLVYTARLGVLCVRGKLEPALFNVAEALGVEAVGDV